MIQKIFNRKNTKVKYLKINLIGNCNNPSNCKSGIGSMTIEIAVFFLRI